jgi:hypothetical protein
MFSAACWEMSKRGGLHVYKVSATMAEVEPGKDYRDGCIRP